MSHQRTTSVESLCSILTCTSDEYSEFYDNEHLNTDILSRDAHTIITRCRDDLQAANQQYRLDDLLAAMLTHAPNSSGKRYVATVLHIAHKKGRQAVVDVAKAWIDHLFFPVMAIFRARDTPTSSSQTPTIDTTVLNIEGASRSNQGDLRTRVAKREEYCCAITGAFDLARVNELEESQRMGEIPSGVPQRKLEAAHIIPFSLNNFNDSDTINPDIKDAARTWDMLQSWTQIGIEKLVGDKINTAANAILMATDEHRAFGKFLIYFDKEAYPNKYKVQPTRPYRYLSNGQSSVDIQFRTVEQSGEEPPDPHFLHIHAAFAKVLHLCGAADYFEKIERDAERNGVLPSNGKGDLVSLVIQKLKSEILVH